LPLFALLDRTFAPLPEPQRIEWLGGCTFAHRGLHEFGASENSLAAFQAAVARGYGIELDVQQSLDGTPMVYHDWDLDRMTGEKGALGERTADQLGAIALSGGGGTIPALAEVLEAVGGKVPLLVEVKTRRETDVVALCRAVLRVLEGYRGPLAVIGFDPRVPHWFSRAAPAITRGLSFTDEGDRSALSVAKRRMSVWAARADFLTYNIQDLPNPFASSQRQRGLKLVAWTISDADTRRHGLECADALICEGAGFP
jgi:glycerophosphoryl diester phosphodiesterase